jgi:hypothetical protein
LLDAKWWWGKGAWGPFWRIGYLQFVLKSFRP